MKLAAALKGRLDEDTLTKLVHSYDLIGDTIVIRIPPDITSKRAIIAEALHTIYPRVRAIAAVPLYSRTAERFRTRDLEVIWGDEHPETTYREHGCIFTADLKRVFISPRLSYERLRIAQNVAPGETIVNMFAGVGCFSILIAKRQPRTKIYSIDVNPAAVDYMRRNTVLNKVEEQVIPLCGDAWEEVKNLEGVADRGLMPLPEQAHAFLPSAIRALKLTRTEAGKKGANIIHYYAVSSGRKDETLFTSPFEQAQDIVTSAFVGSVRLDLVDKRIVRSVAP